MATSTVSTHIEEIVLTDQSTFAPYALSYRSDNGYHLQNLSRVNLCVGANNSGKSRFLRLLAQIPKLTFTPRSDLKAIHQLRHEFYTRLSDIYERHHVITMNGAFPKLEAIQTWEFAVEGEPFFTPLFDMIERSSNAQVDQVEYSFRGGTDRQTLFHEVKRLSEELRPRVKEQANNLPQLRPFSRLYIPTLRGLRRFQDLNDHYSNITRVDYFKNTKDITIFTGLTLYEDIKRLLLGTLEDREIVSAFQNFLSEAFFHGQPVALIPRHDPTVLFVKIGKETEQPIQYLGDGVQSIIILTFPLFRARHQAMLVFIEEPELYLHPGLQRLLLNVLTQTNGFEHFQYFLSTHSNHFLDLTLDLDNISIYTFRKELEDTQKKEIDARFLVENVSNEDERTLALLGVNNSSVFFSNCTIWIEGVTDRRYLSQFFNLYENHLIEKAITANQPPPERFKQDLHYSFVEYSGSNITHWSFLDESPDPIVVERICARLFLVADRDDSTSKAKRERRKKLKNKLGSRFYPLKCREIENILTIQTISKVVSDYEGKEIAALPNRRTSHELQPLGNFIEKAFFPSKKKRRGSYASDSGTVSDKVGFCKRALVHLEKFSDLSDEAQSLTRKIYNFVQLQNP